MVPGASDQDRGGERPASPEPTAPDRATGDVTRILSRIEQGDGQAAEQLLPLVYEELRKLAAANGTIDVLVYDRQAHTVERVSIADNGTQANSYSYVNSMSADGRYVAFYSGATNLVPGDTNGEVWDVFVYDRQTDKIQLVSVGADGTSSSDLSSGGSISADGRYVVFDSSSNLVSGDTNGDYDIFVTANPFAWAFGSYVATLSESQSVSGIDFGNTSSTKFYVVNDATQNLTYEYNSRSSLVESYSLNSGNTAPRGVASTIAGDKTWVVDANRKVYVYNNVGTLLGSWTAGTLSTSATVEGIATDGTDVWIVDAKSDKVYKYTGAATRLSGSQNAASSFSLNSANKSPKDIVTDGVNLWVVNDSTTDKVFKYTTAGALVNSWTITTAGATSPTGITIDPANVSHIWIVDSGTDRAYFYYKAANTSNSQIFASASFPLAPGNTNPQGIADPPVPTSELSHVPVDTGWNVDPSDIVATSEVRLITTAPLAPFPATRASVMQRTSAVSRGVDEVMSRWGSVAEPGRPFTGVARTASSSARRPAHAIDLDVLGNELDAALGLIADDLAAASR